MRNIYIYISCTNVTRKELHTRMILHSVYVKIGAASTFPLGNLYVSLCNECVWLCERVRGVNVASIWELDHRARFNPVATSPG